MVGLLHYLIFIQKFPREGQSSLRDDQQSELGQKLRQGWLYPELHSSIASASPGEVGMCSPQTSVLSIW